MKLFLLTLLLCDFALAQWNPVRKFDSTMNIIAINDYDFFSEQKGYLISGIDGINGNHSSFYRTSDGGITWDSLTTVLGVYSCIKVVTDQIIYAAGKLDVNPNTSNFYESIKICRSLDGGQTWGEHEIFNTTGTLGISTLSKKCFVFQNDSTGFFCSAEGMYYTNTYGTNWTIINNTTGQFPVKLGSEIASFYNNDVYLTDVNTLSAQSNYLDCYGIGGVGYTSSYGDTLIRNNFCSDGWGNMMHALTISELGGSTTVLHFLVDGISDVAINASGIYAASGRPLRSIDGGQSFFKQHCSLPSDSILVFTKMDFINDTTAFALAINLDSNYIKLLKTNNAGGLTSNYVSPPIQYVVGLSELIDFTISVFPNPAIHQLSIETSAPIEQLEINDLSGRNLAKYNNVESKNLIIETDSWHAGCYILKITSEGKTQIKHFQIQ